ncbi:TIGR00730 family Rossman fold protein [Thermaurantiacus tibetensis]|uniref:LOG family protein n=1 Tax=Thermaurantiacus tibetensis TaxID=2759035 RepID=UPI001F3B6CE1|nr:TIGR00730 family Rossman fold protein [Thermaurantiacus tibetensis]
MHGMKDEPRRSAAGAAAPHPFEAPPAASAPGPIRRLLLFCGSRAGADPRHAATARAVGALLARHGVTLVYGGGALGLMGEAARAARAAGGRVEGVIPAFLRDLEVALDGLDRLEVVDSLHTRKARMFENADAVLALPGGMGTLDELVELLSWRSLRLHDRPILLLGDGGFWEPFLALLAHLEACGFAGPAVRAHVCHLPSVAALEALLPPV